MPKKKKTQLKPVARGFATTSVPKKQTEEIPGVLDIPATIGGDTQPIEGAQKAGSDAVQTLLEDLGLDKAEEQSLQNLVDKLQEKTEKEISRTIKVCRYAVTCTHSDILTLLFR